MTIQAINGVFRALKQDETVAGVTFSSVFVFTFKGNTKMSVMNKMSAKVGNKNSMPTKKKTINEVDSVPMAFTACAKERFRENFPSGETSRMMGCPDTCSVAAPAPINNTANKITGNENPTTGSSAPIRKNTNPVSNIFFFPTRDCMIPNGIDNTPNIIIPENETKEAMNGDTLNVFSTTETNCPDASPNPMHKNAKKMGTAEKLFFLFIDNTIVY